MGYSETIKKMADHTRKVGGYQKRFYLGFSQVHKPEEAILLDLQTGSKDPSDDEILHLSLGYVIEKDIRAKLEAIGIAKPNTQREIVAAYDQRARGHIDGETCEEGQIYEIKSTVQSNLEGIEHSKKLPNKHFAQVQTYMHHGGYKSCLMVYVARDTGQLYFQEVWYIRAVGQRFENKIKAVLRRFDEILQKNI